MSKKPETVFAEKVDADLKKRFHRFAWVENIQQVGKIGTPDRLVCIRGAFVALELKTDIGEPSVLQLLKIYRIRRAGGLAFIVTPSNWNKIISKIDNLTKASASA